MRVYVIHTKVGKRYVDAVTKEDVTDIVNDLFKRKYLPRLETILSNI